LCGYVACVDHEVAQWLMLQTGRSLVRFPMVSLEFFIDNPSGRTMASAANRDEYQEYFLGVKAAGA
jgi:hypothetical protein